MSPPARSKQRKSSNEPRHGIGYEQEPRRKAPKSAPRRRAASSQHQTFLLSVLTAQQVNLNTVVTPEDLPHIRMAITRAQFSVSEGGPPRPKVGAVLVKNGTQMGQAHRGDMSPGDHAEFVLLERKLEHEDVSGATLYTTLEPCTVRSSKKQPCAERIVGRKLTRVVIGILDPNQRICGRGVRQLRRAGIEVDLFPSEFMAQVEDQNREFIHDQEQIEAAARATPVVGLTLEKVELEPAPTATIRFKLRMYWWNDGSQLHIGIPRWKPGGIGIQGNQLAYRFQVWENNSWGPETFETDVQSDQQCRIYVGLDPDPKSQQLAPQLLSKGRLGTLVLPVTVAGRLVELQIRPRSSVFSG
jgi:pyrimidine deaminase RibD-like protein